MQFGGYASDSDEDQPSNTDINSYVPGSNLMFASLLNTNPEP